MKRISRVLAFTLLFSGVAFAQVVEGPRQSLTSEGHGIIRGSVGDGKVTYNEHAPLQLRAASDDVNKTMDVKPRAAELGASFDPNFWFYDVDVTLFSDFDRDGYFFGIDLWFDADTNYTIADVYAVVYLSYELGPWNEYAETENFTLFGASGTDDYTIETELISGYSTGDYDILIELYDADTNFLVAEIGPEDSSELSYLPLEDSGRDAASTGGTQVVVNPGGGGSIGWLFALGLLAVRMTLRPQAARLSK
jgi:hypothetical protein